MLKDLNEISREVNKNISNFIYRNRIHINKYVFYFYSLFYLSDFIITDYFYNVILETDKWWILYLKFNSLLHIGFPLIFKLNFRYKEYRKLKIIINVLLAFTIQDYLGRIIYNDIDFHYIDLIVIFIVTKNDLIKYYRLLNIRTKRKIKNERRY